jgi:hypothetical protein
LTDVEGANTISGIKMNPNAWARAGMGAQAFTDSLGQWIDMAGSVMGMVGGMGGGMPGSSSSSKGSSFNQPLPAGGYSPAMFTGGGSNYPVPSTWSGSPALSPWLSGASGINYGAF